MASMTIRNLEEVVKSRLRARAAQHGRSMEDEARHILRTALAANARGPANLFDATRRRIAPVKRCGFGYSPAWTDTRTAALRTMIVLDTNVLPETLRPKPADAVRRWLWRETGVR